MTSPQDLDERFRDEVGSLPVPTQRREADEPVRDGAALTGARAYQLFQAQVASRHLDLAARWMRGFGEGYYTIGSAGHEGNAAIAAALRHTDPALLHYRSGGFFCARATQAAEAADGTGTSGADGTGTSGLDDAVRDVLRGMVASALEPIAGGRHKVFGSAALNVIPTTSTIASHLPRAVGIAFAIERGRRVLHPRPAQGGPCRSGSGQGAPGDVAPGDVAPGDGVPGSGEPGNGGRQAPPAVGGWPGDAIVVCSFGDASVNHASATAALNTAGWCDHTGQRLPLLFVCEDNGIGISVRSPDGWVQRTLAQRPGLAYFSADGCDLVACHQAASEAAAWVRRHRRPAVLHLSMVRLMGHAGADAELAYRSAAEMAADEARDPVLASARLLVQAGIATPVEVLASYDEIGWQVRKAAEEVIGEPKLTTAGEVVAPLAPRRPMRVARAVAEAGDALAPRGDLAVGMPTGARDEVFGGKPPEQAGPLTLAQTLNATLTDALISWPQALVFGEDVAVKGGVYGVTKGLRERFGAARVFDTLLDETSILGLALGAGLAGMLPIAEIQYLAYLHNAEDQLRGEAASMSYFSNGAYRNPLVLRIASFAYQEGFGGHFHNDNAVGVLRDIPGLVLGCPARPDDGAALLRTLLAAALVDGTVGALLEPIALYHTRDLYEPGDGLWSAPYPEPGDWGAAHVPIGKARVDVVGSGADLTILTFGNGVPMSLRAAAALAEVGVGTRVVDLRWLAPLPVEDILRESQATRRVLVVDETRRSGGVGEGILAALTDRGYVGSVSRVASIDSFVPLGPAARHVLVGEGSIIQGARSVLESEGYSAGVHDRQGAGCAGEAE